MTVGREAGREAVDRAWGKHEDCWYAFAKAAVNGEDIGVLDRLTDKLLDECRPAVERAILEHHPAVVALVRAARFTLDDLVDAFTSYECSHGPAEDALQRALAAFPAQEEEEED